MKLTIDRTKWLRGEGTGNSALLREKDGKMCCVGFYCLALGKTKEEISERKWPLKTWPEFAWLVRQEDTLRRPNDETCDNNGVTLWKLNDNPEVENREARIAEAFAKNGVEVEFIN